MSFQFPMSYWEMVRSRAFKDTRAFWNMHQVWKYTGPPVSAIILRLLIRGWSPMHWQQWLVEGMVFIIFGFIMTWGGSYLINLVHIPAILHREQTQIIDALRNDKLLLQSEIDDLKKPTRSKFEQDTYDETKELLDSYDENHKVLFRHLLRHGKMTKILGAKLSPLPPGFREELAASILDKLISDQLVTSDGHPSPSGWTASWQIAPGVKSIIKELLWSNLPAKPSTLTFKLHHYRN